MISVPLFTAIVPGCGRETFKIMSCVVLRGKKNADASGEYVMDVGMECIRY